MGTTGIFGFPFPDDADDPNGPLQIEALAEAVEEQMLKGGNAGLSYNSGEQSLSGAAAPLGTPDRVDLAPPAGAAVLMIGAACVVSATGAGTAIAQITVEGNIIAQTDTDPNDAGTDQAPFYTSAGTLVDGSLSAGDVSLFTTPIEPILRVVHADWGITASDPLRVQLEFAKTVGGTIDVSERMLFAALFEIG